MGCVVVEGVLDLVQEVTNSVARDKLSRSALMTDTETWCSCVGLLGFVWGSMVAILLVIMLVLDNRVWSQTYLMGWTLSTWLTLSAAVAFFTRETSETSITSGNVTPFR